MNPLGTPVIISRFSYSRSRILSDSRVSSGIVWNDGLIRFLGNLEDAMLGFVEEAVDVGRRLVRRARDFSRDRAEAAQHRLVVHDSRVVRDVRGGRHDRRQLGDVSRAADLLEHAAACAARRSA